MTYFGFLLQFVGIPILIFGILNWIDARRGKHMPQPLTSWPAGLVIGALIVVAVAYTTPWDNYLVATRVWWYDPELVTGIVIGWVPIEEYTFFVVQTIMTGMFTAWLMRRMPIGELPTTPERSLQIRRVATGITATIWFASVILLVLSFTSPFWKRGTYLALEVSWGLIPIMLQLIVGADILWRHRATVITAIMSTWIYLSAVDALAILSGTWTINPEQSLPIFVGGVLPIEEAIFFLITNVLVVFGMTLVMEHESEKRIPAAFKQWLHQRKAQRQLVTRTEG
jgi:lycopene cyclase domain-containing protein